MKRVSFILALALVLALAFATTALAALDKTASPTPGDGVPDYASPAAPYTPADGSKLHSNYQKNTDACAACHSTHTGVGASLLQWADVSSTCFACHDGTVTTTYNVVDGQIGTSGAITSGGLFGTGAETNLSTHGVTASLKNNAAPGGANGAVPTDDGYGAWTTDFNCAACHTPHGQGGNARILSADPNGVQTAKAPGQGTNAKETLTAADATYTIYNASQGYWLRGYPYSVKTGIYVDGVKKSTGYTINYELGQVTFSPALTATNVVTAAYVPALRVTMDVANFLTATETVAYKSGVNTFCGACHTDYNTEGIVDGTGKPHGSGEVLSGHYADAYRHQVGYEYSGYLGVQGMKFQDNGAGKQDVVVCLTCHVAHGTDQAYWVSSLATADKKGDGTAYWTTTTATELAGSSALKRKPNMATCESCHKKGFGNSWDSTLTPDTQYK
ncbi:MAG: cytochrome c3 family protein [Symbiobacteriia bacterium]